MLERTARLGFSNFIRSLVTLFALTTLTAPILPVAMAFRPCALITGSTDGIGLTTAKNLAKQGYDVVIHGRDAQRIQRAEAAIRSFCEDHGDKQNDGGRVFTLPPIDISTVAESSRLAQEVKKLCQEQDLKLSVLMNNAGVFSESLVLTKDHSLEQTFAVNVMATFVVTSLLLPLLLESQQESNDNDTRIVIASSISQCQSIRDWDDLNYKSGNRKYSSHTAYSESKLLDAMLSMEFADRLNKASVKGVTCNCLDPGTVNTKMLVAGWGACGIPVEDALDETWLCSSKDVRGVSGRYFVYRNDRKASQAAYDASEREKLWSMMTELAPEAAAVWNGLGK